MRDDLAHALALFGRDDRRGGFLEHFLVAALERAVALAEVDGFAVAVAEHLEFDVARVGEIFFHVDGVVAERRARFGRRLAHQAFELVVGLDDLHSAAAAARRRLDQDRIADLLGELVGLGDAGQRAVGAGHQRQAELGGSALGLDLVAHDPDMLGLRADPDDVVALDDLGELRIFRQEAVARVDGVGMDDLGGRDDVGDVEVGFGRRRRADADGLVGQPDVHRVGVGGRMNRDRLDAHLVAGAVDPQRDLAAIGNQKLLDRHRLSPGPPAAGRTPPAGRRDDHDLLDHAGPGRGDRVHHLHRLDDQQGVAGLHGLADLDERLRAGLRRQKGGADHRRLDRFAGDLLVLARRRLGAAAGRRGAAQRRAAAGSRADDRRRHRGAP